MNDTGKCPDAIVIGAGLAGAAACERLAARGWKLTLLERHAQLAQEASGNLAGIFMPVLSKDDNRTSQLVRAAYLFAHRIWQNLGGVGRAFPGETCGVLQLARDTAHAHVQHEIVQQRQFPAEFAEWLDSAVVNRLLGTAENTGGWWFPQGGWAHPPGVCQAMLAACGKQLTMLFSQDIRHLLRVSHGWQVCNGAGIVIAQAPVVILANGIHATGFSQTARLPLAAVRGQVTHVPAASLPVLPFVLCRDAYLARPFQGICSTGASYDADADPLLRQDSQTDNLARLARLLPHLPLSVETLPFAGRVGFRCVAPDRLPLVGALPDMAAHGFRGEHLRDMPRLPGLYGLLGYASRGLIWAPLAAELLAAQLQHEPPLIENTLVAALDPARFLLKMHRRGAM